MQPIYLTCIGGSGSSFLTKVLHACGMEVGNLQENFMPERVIPDTCQHDILTGVVNMAFTDIKFDVKWRTRGMRTEWEYLESQCPGSMEDKLECILQSYIKSAIKYDWKCFGIKDTRIIDGLDKWIKVTETFKWIWGKDLIIIATVRDPITYIHRMRKDTRFLPTYGEHLIKYLEVIKVWNYILDSNYNARIILYPQEYTEDTIKSLVESVGLNWKPGAYAFNPSKPTRCSDEIKDWFLYSFTEAENAIDKYNKLVKRLGRADCQI